MGGKSLLAKKIVSRIPKHNCYCEVFAGAAWILFKKEEKEESEVEIINDINTDLVTLYRVIKFHLEEFIRFDRPDTFFYVDPPYYGCEDYYGHGIFERDDFAKLRDTLMGVNGKFILSINDVPEIQMLFEKFNIERVETSYSAGGANKKKRVNELLITNY